MDSFETYIYTGAEVWWNDPDHGRCSGYYLVMDVLLPDDEEDAELSENTVVILNAADGSHVEVFVYELSGTKPDGLYPVLLDPSAELVGYASSKEDAEDAVPHSVSTEFLEFPSGKGDGVWVLTDVPDEGDDQL